MVQKIKVLNIPNAISLLRLGMAITLLATRPLGPVFFTLYIFCGVSDVVDGFVARRTGMISKLGAKLDSLGDLAFFLVVAIVLIPVVTVKTYQLVWLVVIVVIRGISFLITLVKFKSPAMLHTYMNKATGLVVFCIPFFIGGMFSEVIVGLALAIATVSSLEEMMIHLLSCKINLDRKSIFAVDASNHKPLKSIRSFRHILIILSLPVKTAIGKPPGG